MSFLHPSTRPLCHVITCCGRPDISCWPAISAAIDAVDVVGAWITVTGPGFLHIEQAAER